MNADDDRTGMRQPRSVFLFDVDNNLLDNDRVVVDLRRHLVEVVGPERADLYFAIFEELRVELGYSDYLGALQRYRVANPDDPPSHISRGGPPYVPVRTSMNLHRAGCSIAQRSRPRSSSAQALRETEDIIYVRP